jgi:peptide/nickel transport system substrate-binding protein
VRRRLLAAVVLVAVLLAGASAATATDSASLRGGTYRVGGEAVFDFSTAALDPTGEADPRAFGLFSNLLVRTLVGYRHVAGPSGRELVPDLAVSVPSPTNGGRTYTFRLKRGIRFAPPVNREIVSKDIRYALERLARPRNNAQYPYYYRVIRGFDAYRGGETRSISGIKTPSPKTIRFELTRPAADFPHRLTLPAAAPIPQEVGRCFEGKPDQYGLDLISSGPYMFQGSERVDIRTCAALKPMSGTGYPISTLVRNPRYDPRTDSRAARENNPDRFVLLAVRGHPAASQVIAKLTAGGLEDAILSSSPKVIGRYLEPARKRGALRTNANDWLLYFSMNLTQPPFDDVHVRRAMAWLLGRAALRDAWGGAEAGPIARHLIPDSLLGGRLKRFDPFATPGDRGSLAKAKAEMAKSKYRTKGGVCVATACKRVWIQTACNDDQVCGDITYAASQRELAFIKPLVRRIGITFAGRRAPGSDIRIPSFGIAVAPSSYWRGQYRDPSSFLDALFAGDSITPRYNPNTSLLGITPGQARALGIKGRIGGVPSVDADLARCGALTGPPRLDCYAALDRKLTADLVPFIPFLWRNRITILGPQVAKWAFDESTGTTAFAHVAVKR